MLRPSHMGVVDLLTRTLSMVWHENCHEALEGTYVPITTAYEGYSLYMVH